MSQATGIELIGRDFSCTNPPVTTLARGPAIALFAGALLAALFLSTLRTEIIDLRYDLAERVRSERALLDERSALTVEVRRLHDPARLRVLARERGFGPAERVLRTPARVAESRGGRRP